MKQTNKTTIILSIISLISLTVTLYFYQNLPDIVPTHFGLNGEVDDYGPKHSVLILAALPLIIAIAMPILARIDPRHKNFNQFSKTFCIIQVLISLILIAIHWTLMLYLLGIIDNVSRLIALSMGVMLVVLGNYMPKIKHNYTLGVRTPWTIHSKLSWEKSHRLAGYLFTPTGIIVIISAIINQTWSSYILVSGILAEVGIITIYSYIIYKQEEKNS